MFRKAYAKAKEWLLNRETIAVEQNRNYPSAMVGCTLDKLPPFYLWTAEMMLRDPHLIFGLMVRNGALLSAEVEFSGNGDHVAFVESEWKRIWDNFGGALLRAKRYGYMPFEVTYRKLRGDFHGFIGVDQLNDFHPRDCRPMTRNGELAAVKFQRLRQSGSREVATPASLWVTYGREYGNWFGRSINQNSYSPWYEKWMESGAKDVMRRRMIKDSYRSGVYMVPDEIVTMPDGTKLHWMDIARRGDEVALSGASVVLPQKYDANGNPMMKYEPPKDFGTPTGILEWNDRIDWDIWKGQGVFREVFEAASSGSGFSGRSIPLMMFLGSVSEEFKEVLHCVNRDVLRPACHINFGCQPDYEVIAKPLTEVFAEDMSGNQMGGGAMGGPASSQQSGGWNQQQGPRGGQQWVNSSTGAVSYKQPAQFSEGARSYSCLMGLFESNVTEHVRQLGRNISTADLALDGIEKNPHVTLLWGIHSDESEQIRFVLKRYGPFGLRLGGLGCFEGDDQDVLYVSVESNAIHEIRSVLESSIPNTQTHDCYIPHVTLAYLRPGMGKKYVENPQLLGHADEQDSLAWVSTLEFSN